VNINGILAFLWVIVQSVLTRVANEVWDGLWEQIIIAVNEAEAKWEADGRGAAKKAEVVAAVMTFVKAKAELSWLQNMLLNLFVSKAVDAIVTEMNEAAGKGWGAKVAELEQKFANQLPVIE